MPFLIGLGQTIDPKKGGGWSETVIFLAIVGTAAWMLIAGQKVPEPLWGLLGMIVGYFVGHNDPEDQGGEE